MNGESELQLSAKIKTKFVLPFRILKRDKSLYIWLVITFLTGFINQFLEFFSGEKVVEESNSGLFYIFSVTILIPTVSDSLVSIWKELSKFLKERKDNNSTDKEFVELPYLEETSAIRHTFIIGIVAIFLIFFMSIMYFGKCKNATFLQFIFSVVSIYLAFYYKCIDSIVQHPESYIKNEEKEVKELQSQSKKTNSIQNKGKEIVL